MHKQLIDYEAHCAWRPTSTNSHKPLQSPSTSAKPSNINFNAQVAVSPNLYKIELENANNNNNNVNNNNKLANGDGFSTNAIANINLNNKQTNDNVIINSVENFQLVPNAFIESSKANKPTSSQSMDQRKTSESSNDKINIAPNAPKPEKASKLSSTTAANRKNVENAGSARHIKPVPNGVVPIQSSFDDKLDKNDAANENNRYANIIDDAAGERKDSDEAVDSLKEKIGDLQNVKDKDNVAKEVNDNNDFIMDELNHKNHLNDAALLKNNNNNHIKNDAGEDMNLYDNKVNLLKPKKPHRLGLNENVGDDDFEVVHHDKNGKLKNEIDGDQGKVIYEESHLEEQNEEDDG